ncbi:hypothetical protein BOX15_Mlig017631g2, partial [Macrostomum lignano]
AELQKMSSNYTVNCLLDSVAKTCGEGPFWEPVTKTLYFVSIADGEVHVWSEPNNYHSTIQVGEQPGNFVSFVIPCQSGGFLAGINKSIVHCDWQAGELKRRVLHEVDPQEPIRFNDAKCDPAGRLLAGTMSLEKEAGLVMKPGAGSLFGLDLDGSIKTLDTGLTAWAGMATRSTSPTQSLESSTPTTGTLRRSASRIGELPSTSRSCPSRRSSACRTVWLWTQMGGCGWPASSARGFCAWTRRVARWSARSPCLCPT